ncbi:LptF/LptG family permease [Thermosynechococcus sp.]|uniref:LptF/LptG family permease n=1 Tax=Thermosynechococcus sp. TaxID=2814275 RepID=UPI00391ABA19
MIRALRRFWLPTLPQLDQYLLSLLLPGFIFGVTIFTTLALTVGTIFDLVRQIADAQLPLTILLQLIGYQLPTVLVLVFPMAVLLAVVGAMSRLSEEGEWIALRSVGICLRRVLVPVVIFALFVSGLTLALNEIAVPIAKYESQKLMRELLQQERTLGSGTDIFYPEYDRHGNVRRLYYGHRFDGSRIQGITVLDFSQPQITQVISAESAEWNVRESRWLLSQGVAYLISHTGVSRNLLQFEQQEIRLPRPAQSQQLRPTDVNELSITQARRALQRLDPEQEPELVRALEVHVAQSYAQPFLAVVFALLGVGFGLSPSQRRGRQGFGISVAVVFGQYVLTFFLGALGTIGTLSPLAAAWLPHGIGLAVAIALLWRADRS